MVVTKAPVGSEVYKIKPEYLDGAWIGGHNIYFVDASKSMEGVLKVSTVGKRDGEYALTHFTVLLRQGAEQVYANVRTDVFTEKGAYKGPDGWFVFIVKETDTGFELLYPDRQGLVRMIQDGGLDGSQEPPPYITLNGGTDALTALYDSGKLPVAVFDELEHHVVSVEMVSMNIERDPQQYAPILAKWRERGMADHFPDALPDDDSGVRLSYFGGFMQAGAWFQLHVTLPVEEAQAVYTDMMARAIAYKDGDYHQYILKPDKAYEGDIPGTGFHTSKQLYRFPKDYRIFILEAKPYKTDPTNWNHGQCQGVVVNRTTGEVIYFVEDW